MIINNTMTIREVSDCYNIGTKQIRSFIRKRITKGKNYDIKGRCPKLDTESSNAIERRYKEANLTFQSEAQFRNDLKLTIKAEAIRSYERNTGNHFQNKIKGIGKIISTRTLNRRVLEYMNSLIKFVSISNNNHNNNSNNNTYDDN